MSGENRIAQTLILVAGEAHQKLLRAAGKKFVHRIDPTLGGEQVVRFSPTIKQWALMSEFEAFQKFILALPAGLEVLRDDIAIRLGDERVTYVEWSDSASIDDMLSIARPMWTDEVSTLYDIPEPGEEKTYTCGFPSLDAHGFRFVLPAFMTVIGPYGSGKSVLLQQLLWNLWRLHKWRFLLTSFEEKVKPRYRRDFRRYAIGQPIDAWTDKDVIKADAEIARAGLFLRRKRNTVLDLGRLLDRLEFAIRVYGVRVIAIDPVNELDHEIQKGETATEYLRKFIMELKKLADDYGLLIICCAHPPKDGTEKRLAKSGFLTLNDGDDTAHWGQQIRHRLVCLAAWT
jgi:hypothetical protein